jgi:hypothetical protein
VAGVFTNSSALNNGGETIKLEDADNGTIREFAYGDEPPWPAGTDGSGYSLVLIAPYANPDHSLTANWRSSTRPGGSPGGADVAQFPANPMADANGNGERDLIDYALGNDLGLPPILPAFTFQPAALGGSATLLLTYPLSPDAERVRIEVLFSINMVEWQEASPHLEAASMERLGDGRELVTWRVKSPLRDQPQVYMRLRVTAQ